MGDLKVLREWTPISCSKKMIKESKLMLELKNREYYTKPSEKRRNKSKKAKKKLKK